MKITAYAPATTANVSVGFDSLGLALQDITGKPFGDFVTVTDDPAETISVSGDYADQLPADPQHNIIVACRDAFHALLHEKKRPAQPIGLHLEKGLPIGSGLGSSAASIVAALKALNVFYDSPLSAHDLLVLTGQMEGQISGSIHYDNVAPALLGGLQMTVPHNIATRLPWFADWYIVIHHPGIIVSTNAARQILPLQINRSDAIDYWQNFASFVHALHTQNEKLATSVLHDALIEPYRAGLIPNFVAGQVAARQQGALAFGISGSGPACFAIATSETDAHRIREAVAQAMQGTNNAFSRICRVADAGATIIAQE